MKGVKRNKSNGISDLQTVFFVVVFTEGEEGQKRECKFFGHTESVQT